MVHSLQQMPTDTKEILHDAGLKLTMPGTTLGQGNTGVDEEFWPSVRLPVYEGLDPGGQENGSLG